MAPLVARPPSSRHSASGSTRSAPARPLRPAGWGFEAGAERAQPPKLTSKELPRPPEDRIHTAGHELNHAIVAMHLGWPVAKLTTIPGEDYSGLTAFSGSASAEVMMIVFTAGSVSTHDGTAQGYGSDMFQAELISAIHGGSSVERARAIAATIINQYDIAVRERAAVLIATQGTVTGGGVRSILDQAQNEIAQERAIERESLYTALWAPDESMQKEYITNTDELTVVSTDGDISHVTVFGGDVNRELTFCNHCGHYDGHSETCIKAHKESSDEPELDAIKKPEIPQGETPASEEFDLAA